MARGKRWKLVLTGTDEQYLFDERDDPSELRSRIDDPERKPVADRLRDQLRRWMKRIGDRDFEPRP